jgi:hypothetical protein
MGGAVLVLVSSMPCYITGKCCGEPGHVDNFDREDFEEDIIDAQETHRPILMSWAASNNIQAANLAR